jgi:chromosome segregation protein
LSKESLMVDCNVEPFKYGSAFVRADFHLHTKADKEFNYSGEENSFCSAYVQHMKNADIRLGVITNHNKFDFGEFKALRRKARTEGIHLLPGIELSVGDGANGVHTLIVFSERWLEEGQDYINQFLNVAFSGKTPSQYEQENGRSNHDLLTTIQKLKDYDRDFFMIFAHVEAPSGLWKEIAGGRMQELAKEPLIKEYCLGFQKVRTFDKADSICQKKVKEWWTTSYPAELEGSDPKNLVEIGRGQKSYIKIGDFNFEAVKYALKDHQHRVIKNLIEVKHSHIKSIRFEGGFLDGHKLYFSSGLNCLIGIRGSGKSSILESIRYVLDLPFGEKSQDKLYKEKLLPYLLKSGGKLILEAVDKLGNSYEIHRILSEHPDVYINGQLRTGISIQATIIQNPIYFGQKDLSATGEGFGYDLVEKLVGEQLKPLRQSIEQKKKGLINLIGQLQNIESDGEQKPNYENQLKDINFKLELFKQHGIEEKLEKQIEFERDIKHCKQIDILVTDWSKKFQQVVEQNESEFLTPRLYTSKVNTDFFERYKKSLDKISNTFNEAKIITKNIDNIKNELITLRLELENSQSLLKDEFAQAERDMVQTLESKRIKTIQPDDYVKLTHERDRLNQLITSLNQKASHSETIKQQIVNAIVSLNEEWREEFKLVQQRLASLNQSQEALNVDAKFKGDKTAFITKMDEVFKGSSIRKDVYQALADKYSDFGDIYKDLEIAITKARSKAEILRSQFFSNLSNLLTYQIPNSYEITYHNRELKSHSLGQRASAMMLFILSQKENDVFLIDQPEDDLDNQTIYEEVVKLLRKLKPNQQFIFATHNANFPVLGDAELVVACTLESENMTVNSGSIDCPQTQQTIINIMEGGMEAFNRRKVIYHLWKANSLINEPKTN